MQRIAAASCDSPQRRRCVQGRCSAEQRPLLDNRAARQVQAGDVRRLLEEEERRPSVLVEPITASHSQSPANHSQSPQLRALYYLDQTLAWEVQWRPSAALLRTPSVAVAPSQENPGSAVPGLSRESPENQDLVPELDRQSC